MAEESRLEKILVRRVQRELGGFALKWVSPGTRGVPDRIVILPDGNIAFVEMKAPGGSLHPLQEHMIKKLGEKGHDVYVLASESDIDEFVRRIERMT
jgi:hypothetical protein